MNVMLISSKYPPEYAGSGLRAHKTYQRLARKYGVDFEVVTSSITSNQSRRYEWEGVPVTLIANKSNNRVNWQDEPRRLVRLMKRLTNKWYVERDYWLEAGPTFFHLRRHHQKYDLIHIFGNVKVTSVALSYAKITGKPLVVELVNLVNDPHQSEPKWMSRFWGQGFPPQTLLVCISEHLKQVCLGYGYSEEQIWCRPNPIDESRFFYDPDRRATYRTIWPELDESDVLLVYLAKFMPLKNQLFLVDVMRYLPEQYKLILVGPLVKSGPLLERDHRYYEQILAAIRAQNLEKRIQVKAQFTEQPEKYIKAADVFVMPTTREAFGTPVVEALACGVPVVANDIPNVFDQWLENGVNGYICPLDAKAWAEKIMLAAKIDEQRMKQASEKILSVASTEVIDRGYYQRLTALAKKQAR